MAILASYKTKIIDGNVKALAKVQGHHLNRPELRRHSKWGAFSNSDMMPGIIAGIMKRAAIGGQWFDLQRLPDCVTVEPDKSGFMATVHLHG